MAITANSPYQIFKTDKLPASWEIGFLNNLKNMPLKMQPELKRTWEVASKQEFPSRKDESWRWMDFKDLDLDCLKLDSDGSPIRLSVRHVKEDGEQVTSPGSLPEGVIVKTLRELLALNPELAVKLLTGNTLVEDGMFAALPHALANDGLIVYVPHGVSVEGVVQCFVNISLDGRAAFTRNLVWLEEGANINLEIAWLTENRSNAGFHNGILDVHLGDRSNLHFDERQQLDLSTWNVTHEVARLGVDAQLDWNYAALGSVTSKNFIRVELEGKGSQANLNGIMFPSDNQVINLDTRQNHWAEQTFSDLLYKSVTSDGGRSIWHGMIYVDPEAKKTDAYQSNKNLILDESADVKSVPGLEILNDDVKCSHGATMGDIDEEELYYLQARGIPPKEAKTLIVQGFCDQVVQSFRVETTRKDLLDQLMDRMSS